MFGKLTLSRRHVPRLLQDAASAGLLAFNMLSVPPISAQDTPSATVILTEYQFNPKTITLTLGQPVQLNIQNQGGGNHSLLSDIPLAQVHYQKADNTPAEIQRYEAQSVLNADAVSGHTSVVTFTPTKAGTFEFFSEDEESLGMVGNFVVVAPGAQTAAAPPTSAPAPAAPTASATVARDGQSLSGQSAATQALFSAVWGDRAAQEWVQEHNSGLPK
jgi:plastocyanin